MPPDTSSFRTPPRGLFRSLGLMGPGFVLSAAVVGSGELIATTSLGAKAGFVLLWVVLLSCVAKVAVQLEYGRHSIVHGCTPFQAWNRGAGPRIRGIHWSLYGAFFFLLSTLIGAAGIMGAAAPILSYVFPRLRVELAALLLALVVGALVSTGRYGLVEKAATLFNLIFVSCILYCNIATQATEYAYGFGELLSGLTFDLPPEGLILALAVFGITGVGAGEIVTYPYWCIEKGYAAWTGRRDDSAGWLGRARGWIRVMQLDALISMLAYTVTTCGFFMLGAAILRRQDSLADGNRLVLQLSDIFTESLGPGARAVFMACAFTVLFSTLFSNAAGLSRLWADLLHVCGVVKVSGEAQKRKLISVISAFLPLIWAGVYIAFQRPLNLVVFMGISNTLFLLVVAFQALYFRYRETDGRLIPSLLYDLALWGSVAAIGVVAFRAIASIMGIA